MIYYPARKKVLRLFAAALTVMLIFCAQADAKQIKEDRDEDGFKETIVTKKGNTIIKEETDKNKDGKIDQVLTYSAGKPKIRTRDTDYNGKVDAWDYFNKEGARRRSSQDTNDDGKPDYWKFYQKGSPAILREYDRNFDGKVDRRKLTNFMFHRAMKQHRHLYLWLEEDSDFDGVIDVYRVRGEKTPNPDKTGQPMDPHFKKIIDEQPKKSGEKLTGIKAELHNMRAREDLVQQSREGLGE